MRLKTSKLNEFRLWGLLLTLIGMGIMLLGMIPILLWGHAGRPYAFLFFVIGMFSMLGSVAVYFFAGVLSTSAVVIECPECGKPTKMLGKSDRCMFCKTLLTLEPPADDKPADDKPNG